MNPSSVALTPGTTLQKGKYCLERTLGEGGFGITYRARSVLHDAVAVKELFLNSGAVYCAREADGRTVSPRFDPARFSQFKKQFLDEAKLLATFKQVLGVVDVLDFFEENGTAYFVMEYISETTLADFASMTQAQALRYIQQVGAALEAVHQRGILHRDLKPSNILLDVNDRAVLIDFGIARSYVQDQTAVHTTFHSPGYAAPEQTVSSAHRGAYTDVYALGGTLYFCLTGQRPPSLEERSLHGFQSVRALNPTVSREVDAAVTKALEPIAKNRFQTIREFLNALTEVEPVTQPIEGGPRVPQPPDDSATVVMPRPPLKSEAGSPLPPLKPNQSKRWVPILVVGVLVAAGLSAGLYLTQGGDLEKGKIAYQAGTYEAAYTMLLPVAEKGNQEAQLYVGFLLNEGKGVAKDDAQAREWFQKAASNGNSVAQYNLAVLALFPKNKEPDPLAAYDWFRKAADQGHASSQVFIGTFFKQGIGSTSVDTAEAERWFRKAAEQNDPRGQYELGELLLAKKEYTLAHEWIRKAAEQGLAAAQNRLGVMYDNGNGTGEDEKLATTWYQKAAGQNSPEALYNLGYQYYNGEGVDKEDKARGLTLMRKAAGMNFEPAQSFLQKVDKNSRLG